MKDNRVGWSLAISIFVMTALPLTAAFYLLQDALRTSLNLGFNPQIVRTLENASDNLRTLGRLDEVNRTQYHAQFDEVEGLKQVYSDPDVIKQRILDSLRLYFGLGLGITVSLSLVVATLLSRRIARSHARNITELARERDKVRYLQEMSSWQQLAKMLAHEIKNPLTPIEVLVTSLSKAYLARDQQDFLAHLEKTQAMIGEELHHLKSTVNKFSEFARMPQVQLTAVNLAEVLERQLSAASAGVEANVQLDASGAASSRVRIDTTLFRQVLANILRNAVEANPGRRVRFTVSATESEGIAVIRIANDGVPVPPELAERMFDPYISSKTGQENMGLGLAIVKKIVLEHGGDIRHEDIGGHPAFFITLPRLAS